MSQGKPAISRFIEVHIQCEHCRRRTAQFLDILVKEDHVKCSHAPCGRSIDLMNGENALLVEKLAEACRIIRNSSDEYRAFPASSVFDPYRNPDD